MTPHQRAPYWLGILSGAMAGGLLSAGFIFYATQSLPVEVRSIRELDSIVIAGGRIDLLVDRTRRRDCPATTQRWLQRPVKVIGEPDLIDKYVPLYDPGVPVRGALSGKVIVSLQVPRDIEPGSWTYGSRTEYQCSWLSPFRASTTVESPPVKVEVAPAP